MARAALLLILLPLSVTGARAQESTPRAIEAGLTLSYELRDLREEPYEVEQYTLVGDSLVVVSRRYRADVGTLVVPERRGREGARRITLPIVRIRATGPDPAEPIFWLDGGPGQTNMGAFDFDYFVRRHDHVLVGYRGVDGSVSLDCPEVVRVLKRVDDVLTDASLRAVGDGYAECWERLRGAGVDVNGYTTVEVVRDLESARRALGYDRIHLLAESYGTRLAYLYGVMYPEAIRRTVMIGANPPGGMVWQPAQYDAIFRRYAALWRADPKARARTEDLAEAVRAVHHGMPRRWLVFPIRPGNVQASANAMLFQRASAARVFDTYVAAANGDPSGLWLISVVAPFIFPEIVNWGDNASKAVSADGDPTRDFARELMPDDAIMGAPLGRFLWGPGRRWPIEPIPEPYRRMQTSEVETLVLSGGLDFSTPPENTAALLMPHLPNGVHVVAADLGHLGDLWGVEPAATHRLLTSFLEEGVADSGGFRPAPMSFEVRWGYPALAKLALAGTALSVLLVAVLLRWLVRILRRRRAAAA